MKFVDYLLICCIVAAVILAVRTWVRSCAQGKSCSGDCANCSRKCTK